MTKPIQTTFATLTQALNFTQPLTTPKPAKPIATTPRFIKDMRVTLPLPTRLLPSLPIATNPLIFFPPAIAQPCSVRPCHLAEGTKGSIDHSWTKGFQKDLDTEIKMSSRRTSDSSRSGKERATSIKSGDVIPGKRYFIGIGLPNIVTQTGHADVPALMADFVLESGSKSLVFTTPSRAPHLVIGEASRDRQIKAVNLGPDDSDVVVGFTRQENKINVVLSSGRVLYVNLGHAKTSAPLPNSNGHIRLSLDQSGALHEDDVLYVPETKGGYWLVSTTTATAVYKTVSDERFVFQNGKLIGRWHPKTGFTKNLPEPVATETLRSVVPTKTKNPGYSTDKLRLRLTSKEVKKRRSSEYLFQSFERNHTKEKSTNYGWVYKHYPYRSHNASFLNIPGAKDLQLTITYDTMVAAKAPAIVGWLIPPKNTVVEFKWEDLDPYALLKNIYGVNWLFIGRKKINLSTQRPEQRGAIMIVRDPNPASRKVLAWRPANEPEDSPLWHDANKTPPPRF